MDKGQLLKTASKIVMAYNTIEKVGQVGILPSVAEGMGYSVERVLKAIEFLQENITEEEMNTNTERDSFVSYLEAIDEIEKQMEMAKGYQEMGDINLKISQDSFQAEEEGENKTNEMVAEDTQGDTQAG